MLRVMADQTRYYDARGTVAREHRTEAGLEIAIFDVRARQWVPDNSILGHISGIGGDGDWNRIDRETAAEIIARATGQTVSATGPTYALLDGSATDVRYP
jgi:hypothetical protein